jgi:hypothetical protein
MLRTSKGAECADSNQNHQKIIGTPNQYLFKIFPKKVCLSPTEFAPETEKITGLKLNSKNLNLKKKSV